MAKDAKCDFVSKIPLRLFRSGYGQRYAFVDFFYCPLLVRYFDAALQRRCWAVGCVIRNRIELYNATNRFLGLGPFRWVFHWMLVGAPFDGQRGTFAYLRGLYRDGGDWIIGPYVVMIHWHGP